MTLYTQQSKNIRRTWLLMSAFLILIIGLGWIFSRAYGNPLILYFAIISSFFVNFLSYWYSDKIALSMAGAKEIKHDEMPEIYHIVENLCITAGLKMPKIYLIEDPAPNAFATGRNQNNAAIAVTRGLLEQLNRSELEGVIAHELSHIGNRDILVSTIAVVLVGIIAMISDFFLRISFWSGGERGRNNRSNGIIMLIGIISAVLAPIAATLIQLAISRKREFLADASAALLTRYPDGLASALQKISQYPVSLKRANNSTAHLYIANPFKGKSSTSWFVKIFSTHPPVEERIKALRGINV